MYLSEIDYPGNIYRVRFAREDRNDYPSCDSDDSKCAGEKQRLKWIYVEYNPDLDAAFAGTTIVRKYELGYVEGAVLPATRWRDTNYGNSTLMRFQEYGISGTNKLPATTFTYSDQMHLTAIENGYNGKVEMIYEASLSNAAQTPWPTPDATVDVEYPSWYNRKNLGIVGSY